MALVRVGARAGGVPVPPHEQVCVEAARSKWNLRDTLDIQSQVKANNGYVKIPETPGIGVNPDLNFIKQYEILS